MFHTPTSIGLQKNYLTDIEILCQFILSTQNNDYCYIHITSH